MFLTGFTLKAQEAIQNALETKEFLASKGYDPNFS